MLLPSRATPCLSMLLILLAASQASRGQEILAEEDQVLLALDARISQFLDGISTGQAEDAYRDLLAGSRLLERKKALAELTEKTEQLEDQYGRWLDSEQIGAKRVGSDLALFRYLYKCEHYPVVWFFAFYRVPTPGEAPIENAAWRVVTVRLDTELEELL